MWIIRWVERVPKGPSPNKWTKKGLHGVQITRRAGKLAKEHLQPTSRDGADLSSLTEDAGNKGARNQYSTRAWGWVQHTLTGQSNRGLAIIPLGRPRDVIRANLAEETGLQIVKKRRGGS